MEFSLAPLLIHHPAVPEAAREALSSAVIAPPAERQTQLENAARILYRETDLDCSEVRELVGLSQVG
jgi:hypothetical protein